jgi:hypothetical protein
MAWSEPADTNLMTNTTDIGSFSAAAIATSTSGPLPHSSYSYQYTPRFG